MTYSSDRTNETDGLSYKRNQSSESHLFISSSNLTSSSYSNRNTNNKKKQVAISEVVYGEKNSDLFKKIFLNCTHTCCMYCDRNGPSLIFEVPVYTEFYIILKNKNIKIRFITEITSSNVNFCKQIIRNFGAEIKHLKGAKGNFFLSDNKEFVSTSSLKKISPFLQHIIVT